MKNIYILNSTISWEQCSFSKHSESKLKNEKILLTEVLSLWAEHMICGAENCRLKALGLYIFLMGFRRVCKLNGGASLYPRGIITGMEKAVRNTLKQCWLKDVLQLLVKASKYHNYISNSFQYKLEESLYRRACYWCGLYQSVSVFCSFKLLVPFFFNFDWRSHGYQY